MTDLPRSLSQISLTPQKIEQIFPIAPRDRRENADLFIRFIDQSDIRDNAKFYAALLSMMGGDGIEMLRIYDQRMNGRRSHSKTFSSRAWRFIRARMDANASATDVLQLAEWPFESHSPEDEIRNFLITLLHGDREPVPGQSVLVAGEAAAREAPALLEMGWQETVTRIADLAGAFEGPDPDGAANILALAEQLVEACRREIEAEAERASLMQHAEALRQRLLQSAPLLAEHWPEIPAKAWLEALNPLLDDLDSMQQAHDGAQAAFEGIKSDLRNAVEGDDFDLAREKTAEAQRAQARLACTFKDLSEARRAVARLIYPPAADEAACNRESVACGASEDIDDDCPEAADDHPARTETSPVVTPTEGAVDTVQQEDQSWAGSDDDMPTSFFRETSPSGMPSSVACKAGITVIDAEVSRLGPALGDLEHHQDHSESEDDDRLLYYLKNEEISFAWYLARMAEEEGQRLFIPSAVLYGLAILQGIGRAEDMAESGRSEAMAKMMAAMPDARDVAAASRLTLAALLRPAFFDPDHGARGMLANFPLDSGLNLYKPLIDVLANLEHDTRLSVQLLVELAGNQPSFAETKARAALQEWSVSVQDRKTKYLPASKLFHHELRIGNTLGDVVDAVVSQKPHGYERALEFVHDLSGSRTAQENWVLGVEQRHGRPAKSRIQGAALDWVCCRLQEACDLLQEWLRACDLTASGRRDHARERLLRNVGALRKVLRELGTPAAEGEGIFEDVTNHILIRTVNDLRSLVDGSTDQAPRSGLNEIFSVPLLRLPGGCQDWTDGAEGFDDERAIQKVRLLAALRKPDEVSDDFLSAFFARLQERAILPAHALLRRLSRGSDGSAEVNSYTQPFDEACNAARNAARDRVERLRQEFATLGYLLQTQVDIGSVLARLSAIAEALRPESSSGSVELPAITGRRTPEVPPDFPELDDLLNDLEQLRDKLRSANAERQRDALQSLLGGPLAATAQALLQRIEHLDPVTVDDSISELNAGRDVPLPEPDGGDSFTHFFPTFVEAVDAAGVETARGRVLPALHHGRDLGPLRIAALSDLNRQRARQMLEIWATTENAMAQAKPAQLRDAVVRLFGQVGLTGVRVTDGRELIQGRLRSFALDCDVPRSTTWFLPPTFGSMSGGRYRILTARSIASHDQIVRQTGSDAPDAAWIVLFFGRLDVQDRHNLARRIRIEGRQALILDETLLLYLAIEADDPLEALFTCAMPFSWVQPYTITPGQIPREAFFGRDGEIGSILSRDGSGCLVYGGRQLGKSALLNHIRGERHRPDLGELVIYLDIKPIGGAGINSNSIWEELAHELRRLAVFSKIKAQPAALLDDLRVWLEAVPSRRIIVMFDEADNFFRAEHAAGYPNLTRLKNLMETTSRRFKIVFAGLHNVRRMSQAPNSPLPHLGEPICIGPMNVTRENRAALRRLATDPMRAAGFDYADPALVSDMLARMNYYPSLVQVFGRQIVESLGRRPSPANAGPRWKLDREMLFEGETAGRIAAQIRERFQLTLNLDLRYECIAKSMALHRLDMVGGDTQVLARGLTAREIQDITFWPEHLAPHRLADFAEILEEMVDLGVLGRLGGDRYGLRNAQIAQMLGQRDTLENDLLALHEREQEPAYDAAEFHGLLRPHLPDVYAPLPDRALQSLFDFQISGLRVVVAPVAVVGADAAERLKVAAQIMAPQGDHMRVRADESQIRKAIDRAGKSPMVLVIDGAWSLRIADLLGRQLEISASRVLPIWCVESAPEGFSSEGGELIYAGAWTDAMLRHWLANEGLASALDDGETRSAIMRASGGAPARLIALKSELVDIATQPLSDRLLRLQRWGRDNPLRPDVLGLSDDEMTMLRTLSVQGGAGETDDGVGGIYPDPSSLKRLVALGCLREPTRGEHVATLTALGHCIIS